MRGLPGVEMKHQSIDREAVGQETGGEREEPQARGQAGGPLVEEGGG